MKDLGFTQPVPYGWTLRLLPVFCATNNSVLNIPFQPLSHTWETSERCL